MDWLKRVVKVEATTTLPLNIRGLLSKCGEIIDLYPCKTNVRGCAHVFIKFKDEQSAKRATDLEGDIPNIHVYSLSDNPDLVEQYQGVNSHLCESDALGVPRISRNISVPTAPRKPSAAGRKKAYSPWATELPGRFTDLLAPPINVHLRAPALLPHDNSPKSQQLRRASNPSDETTSKQQPIISNLASRPSTTFPTPPAPRAPIGSSPPTSVQPPSYTPGPVTQIDPSPFSPNTQLSLYFHGEVITYDLKALDSDSRPIIKLLKITDSERGSWMTVGAHYRRSGNIPAAMSVIQTMIQAMTEHGILEDDLKPAFLFLSGCETDLARQARAAESIPEVASHCTNARMWLEKVYGSGINPTASRAMVESVASSRSRQSKATEQAIDRGADVDKLNPTTTGSLSQHRIFEREIQNLRDRQHEQSNLFSEMRVAKRKLEDDIDYERDLRYRIQRRLEDTRKELDMARKMEAYALDQVKREVEARRKAEDTTRAEKNKRLELQKILEEPNARPPTNTVQEVE